MSKRRRQRFLDPAPEPLEYAVAAHRAISDGDSERGRAFLSAAKAGWTVREIAAATSMSPSTAWRIIVKAEAAGEENGR